MGELLNGNELMFDRISIMKCHCEERQRRGNLQRHVVTPDLIRGLVCEMPDRGPA